MLKLKNITKTYQTKSEIINAVNSITYNFKKGTLYAIMGHSGSGKSTLLNIIGLIEENYEGEYNINNKNVKSLSDKELANIRNEKIGFIFQDYYLDFHLKAYENVMLPMVINKNINKNERKNRAIELLELVGLNQRFNHFPREMSGGEQQRVCLARALANDPDIILADEPTGNLDENNEKIIFKKLKELSKDKCIIVISHSNSIKEYADVTLYMKNGKLVQENDI